MCPCPSSPYIFGPGGRRIKWDGPSGPGVWDAQEKEYAGGYDNRERADGEPVPEGPSPEREEQRGRQRGPEDGRDLSGEREEAEELPELLRRRERHEHHPSYGPHPAERHAYEGSRHEEHPGARRPRGEHDGDEPDQEHGEQRPLRADPVAQV